MKKLFFSLLFALPVMLIAQENVIKIAVLETVDKAGNVEYGKRLFVRNTLTQAIAGTPGYEAYDRVDISAIMSEQDFQRTGNVSEEQIKKVGQMTGAKYVVLPEIAKMDANTFYITAKILDVETAQAVSASGATSTTEVFSIKEACIQMANELLLLPSQRQEKQKKQEKIAKQTEKKEGHLAELNMEFRNGKYYEKGYKISQIKANKIALSAMSNDPEFAYDYNYYNKKSKPLINSGWAMFGTSIACVGLFSGLLAASSSNDNKALFAGAYSCLITGVVAGISSIPLLTVGYKRQNAIGNTYLLGAPDAKHYATTMPNSEGQPYVTMQLNCTGNGFGMAINF